MVRAPHSSRRGGSRREGRDAASTAAVGPFWLSPALIRFCDP